MSWLQKQADNNDSEFKGAIHLVQKMMEVGYGSQLGPATSEHDEKVVRLPNNTSTLSNNGCVEARADYTSLDKPLPEGTLLGECQPSARSTNHHHQGNDKHRGGNNLVQRSSDATGVIMQEEGPLAVQDNVKEMASLRQVLGNKNSNIGEVEMCRFTNCEAAVKEIGRVAPRDPEHVPWDTADGHVTQGTCMHGDDPPRNTADFGSNNKRSNKIELSSAKLSRVELVLFDLI